MTKPINKRAAVAPKAMGSQETVFRESAARPFSSRPLPDWMYAHPDARNTRIAELEAENALLKAMLATKRGTKR